MDKNMDYYTCCKSYWGCKCRKCRKCLSIVWIGSTQVWWSTIQCAVGSPPMHDLAPPHLPRNNTIFQTQTLTGVNSKGAQTFSCDSCITVKSPNLWQLIRPKYVDFLNPQQVGLGPDTFDWYSPPFLILFKPRGVLAIIDGSSLISMIGTEPLIITLSPISLHRHNIFSQTVQHSTARRASEPLMSLFHPYLGFSIGVSQTHVCNFCSTASEQSLMSLFLLCIWVLYRGFYREFL